VERTLGLMCGAGVLPARVAREAKRRGFRVVAFPFGDTPGLDGAADRVIPSSISDIAAVLAGLQAERVSAALFCGKFSTHDLLKARSDAAREAIVARGGGGLGDTELFGGVITTFGAMGIEVLDQRPFFGDWIAEVGPLGRRDSTAEECADIERGLRVARLLAAARVGQTVVLKRGLVAALEASEGTTEAIRRGLALAGPGAVVVKAVAADNDYRFDVPSVGPETIEEMRAGRAAALAIETGRILVLERARAVEIADAAGIAFVSVPPAGDEPGR
jgi:DUF1009 family protein